MEEEGGAACKGCKEEGAAGNVKEMYLCNAVREMQSRHRQRRSRTTQSRRRGRKTSLPEHIELAGGE